MLLSNRERSILLLEDTSEQLPHHAGRSRFVASILIQMGFTQAIGFGRSTPILVSPTAIRILVGTRTAMILLLILRMAHRLDMAFARGPRKRQPSERI